MNPLSTSVNRKRLFWGILAASLLLNGFFVGMAAVGYFDPPRKGGLRGEVDSIGRRLPDEYRSQLRQDVRALLPELRPLWRRLRELRREIGAEAARPQPDRAAIDTRLEEIRALTNQTQALVQTRIFDQVMGFPPEVRAGLARDENDR
ncbi:hypothetical protein GCM10007276_00920 [Agaricicola taiwanensis]|uniref:Zinc resistance-associated protein n=1 Tax=Agaricicola taiwanensis TaxID=591372 RepID=A0A8J2Y9W2_9RHOB|nr:periplasmic heavy metal sensor [Agaricicola taiwanensis]GGE27561.1 hypothetical protein GCM10007276_00920 [Agaricicola taiwanensis]